MNFADVDDWFDSQAGPVKADTAAPHLFNGFYTVTFPDGSYRTFRVRTESRGSMRGKRTLALLIGPENTADYEPFGFVADDGFQVWSKFRGKPHHRYAEKLWVLAGGGSIEGHALNLSRRCRVCNRPLTTPESYERGIGPNCLERSGAA